MNFFTEISYTHKKNAGTYVPYVGFTTACTDKNGPGQDEDGNQRSDEGGN